MLYKTIVLELLKERTELHEQLRLTRRLLPTLERCSLELKASHEAWREVLAASARRDGVRCSQRSTPANAGRCTHLRRARCCSLR